MPRRSGLLTIVVDPIDRRGRLLALTTAGRAVLRAALPLWERTHEEVERQLGGIEMARLRAGLRALT